MDRQSLLRKLSIRNEKKMVLVVLDGVGGLPQNGKTELEAANTPHLDELAAQSECGLTDPISPGITPGSGPAHLSLFGYNPLVYEIGRGILEALGLGIEVGRNDVAVRGNFATLQDGVIVDRRAGRIPTEKNKKIISFLRERIQEIEDVQIELFSGEEHRFVLLLKGEGLGDQVSDADPEVTGRAISYSVAKDAASEKTARVLNRFIDLLTEHLQNEHPANTCLLRGCSRYPQIPAMEDIFKLKTAAIAVYPMYRGLAQLVGMNILAAGNGIQDEITALEQNYDHFDFFFLHIKKTDSYGEDGNFSKKVKVIEEFDSLLPRIRQLEPDVLVITGDHSTPAVLKSHSWHPNPFLLKSTYQRSQLESEYCFSESSCARGVLGRMNSMDILPLMMANALKLKKYGA